MKTISLSLGIPAPPAFMRSTGRKCQLWWLKKNVTEVCIQTAGMEKRQQMWHSPTHYSSSDIWEEGGIKKCFPHPHSPQFRLPNRSRPTHEKGCSSAGKKNISVVCLPCLRWQVRYQTDEEAWHTKSFFLSFQKHQRLMTGWLIYLDP